MHIKLKDIKKDLRILGLISWVLIPNFNEKKFIKANVKAINKIKGKWKSKYTKVEEVYIPRNKSSNMRILVCKSNIKTNDNVTGLLWFHSGGYAIGLPEQESSFADIFCKDGSTVMIIPDYTKSTEKPYPQALEDGYLALKWMVLNHKSLGININQIFVGGSSAGGGLSAALCLYARDKKEISIAFQIPLYPMLDDRNITESSKNNNAPVWSTKSNKEAWRLYLKKIKKDEVPIYAAPSRASDLTNLPPLLSYIGTIEPFYDETVQYINKLKDVGTTIHFKEFEGCFHAFDIFEGINKTAKEARVYLEKEFKYAQKTYFKEQIKKY